MAEPGSPAPSETAFTLGPTARLVDAAEGTVLAGAALRAEVADMARVLAASPGLVFALMETKTEPVLGYLGAIAAGLPVLPLDPRVPDPAALTARFEPAFVLGPSGAAPDGYESVDVRGRPAWRRRAPSAVVPHPDLAVLLTTSGSTGSVKLVRLSRTAVRANTDAIATVLGIGPGDVAMTTLPLFYSYGLSVLNTHLRRGATVVLQRRTMTERAFWADLGTYGVTGFALVPYHYEILRRLRFDPAEHPTLRKLTQAGGRLGPDAVLDLHRRMSAVGGSLSVMYGQTEAGPRMTTLAPALLPAKAGSVGTALPGGRLTSVDGEIVYEGPNVMMGYAEQAADLAAPDRLHGRLPTGDLGVVDADGCLWITGRRSRIAKVFGIRMNLDDVERLLDDGPPAAAVAGEDRVVVFLETADAALASRARSRLATGTGAHPSGFDVRVIDALPALPNGKRDYRTLTSMS